VCVLLPKGAFGKMAPSRFKKDPREKREVTPFNDDPTPVAPPEIPADGGTLKLQ